MTEVGNVYGNSLYELAKEEALDKTILDELTALQESFAQAPEFIKLLASPSLPKTERCKILDESFRGKVHPYVLNFLKILTEKGYAKYFSDCCGAYTAQYNLDHDILPVTAVTAVEMTDAQIKTLTGKLTQITGKQIQLIRKIDPSILGGMRLDYDGQRLDDTVSHRMDAVRSLLSKTVL